MQFFSGSPDATEALAGRVAQLLLPGDFIALRGELGAGKTRFACGLARGLGVDPSIPVTSPTYALLNIYQGRMPLYHFDLYRLCGDDDAVALGFPDYFAGDGVCLVEWPERLQEELPRDRLDVCMRYGGDTGRNIELIPTSPRFRRLLELLRTEENKGCCM